MRGPALALALALALGGCAKLQQIESAIQLGQAGVANPVTPERLAAAENGAIVVFAGLNAYKRSCVDLLLPQSCRGVIASIQTYTRQIPGPLAKLRVWVRANDQINAVTAYNTIVGLIADARSIAAANNVNLGAS